MLGGVPFGETAEQLFHRIDRAPWFGRLGMAVTHDDMVAVVDRADFQVYAQLCCRARPGYSGAQQELAAGSGPARGARARPHAGAVGCARAARGRAARVRTAQARAARCASPRRASRPGASSLAMALLRQDRSEAPGAGYRRRCRALGGDRTLPAPTPASGPRCSSCSSPVATRTVQPRTASCYVL